MNKPYKFYCASAIRGDSTYEEYFQKIVRIVSKYGEPKTEKYGPQYNPLHRYISPETEDPKDYVHYRDIIHWLGESDALIAEYSGASTGVGFEICYATRVRRIPAFCLYHASARPSLIIKQDLSKYTFSQKYSDENELEMYLRCFLEIVTRFEKIDDIRLAYNELSQKIITSETKIEDVPKLLESMLRVSPGPQVQGELRPGTDDLYIFRPKPIEIDFKDSRDFLQFMFRNIILQKRWESLASQRIGATFASGRKFNIILTLAYFDGPTSMFEICHKSGEQDSYYTREAFTKNIRAYRRIGLIATPAQIAKGSTKFKDRFVLTKTIDDEYRVESARSRREISDSLVIVTQHLHHLSSFIRKFGSESLIKLLMQTKRESSNLEVPNIPTLSVDSIGVDTLLKNGWAQKFSKGLGTICKEFWSQEYSSFAKNPPYY